MKVKMIYFMANCHQTIIINTYYLLNLTQPDLMSNIFALQRSLQDRKERKEK